MNWSQIKEYLQTRKEPVIPETTEFWADFKARARYVCQEQLSPAAPVPYFRRWTIATACGLLLMALGMSFMLRSSPLQPEFSRVRSLHVSAPYKGVVIMNDEASKATVVWIVDMEASEDDGDDS